MRKNLLGSKGQFYKANLHCHTTLSDGFLTPEEVKSLYKENGYSVVAFTDHDVLIPHKDLKDDNFLPLNGLEFTLVSPAEEAGEPGKHPTIHLCMIGLEEDNVTTPLYHREKYIKYHPETVRPLLTVDETLPDYERGFEIRDINEVIATARSKGFFVTYNHPGWSHDDPRRILSYEGLNALEVYNSLFVKLGYDDCNQYLYDGMLRAGQKVFPIAADDNHNKYPLGHKLCNTFCSWTQIEAENLDYRTVTKALEDGSFYISNGPAIHSLFIEDNSIIIACDPAVRIVVTHDTERLQRKDAEHEGITSATFKLRPESGWFRVTVYDQNGNFAMTRPYYPEEYTEA
ncbi:MAG: hypothetical protein IKU07_05065 [Oscillospiraceae bacterium]|nr:hypothetical protein [Oscillospiraceae bacterium]